MKLVGLLDRYLLRQWTKIVLSTVIGFPVFVIIVDLVDNLDQYLARNIAPDAIAMSYLYSLPQNIILILPAAVLFATVFSLANLNRHSELTAAKASGRSFQRMIVPILAASMVVSGVGLLLGEVAPAATRKQLELLGERERRSDTRRFNFVYRAEEGWVYVISSLDMGQRLIRDVQLEREGTGVEYPTLVVESRRGAYDDTTQSWTLQTGRMRVLTGTGPDRAFRYDSIRVRNFAETPEDLLAEPKRPEEMAYVELGRYIDALERSGGDGRRLRIDQELKLAIPVTSIVIAIFGAPLAVAAPRTSGAFGIGVSLATTIVFLLAVQLSRAVGAGGVLPPVWAAWLPNLVFGLIGLGLMRRVTT